ncbi:MAG: hypothetical protein JW717_01675 [Marinilabiliaceae bacterium]|nr:hypothetical protein [Marinilabiliaceae bacterium]
MFRYYSLIVLTIITINTTSQTTNSPYSMYGLGIINQSSDTRSFSMGKTGIALPVKNELSSLNPASLTTLDSVIFYINFNLKADYTIYQSKKYETNNFNSNFDNLTFGLKANKWWGIGFGLKSFSGIGYNISTTQLINGSNTYYPVQYEGSGGISKAFLTNSIKLSKNWSAGITTSLLWGQIIDNEISDFTAIGGNSISNTTTYHLNKFHLETGVQYHGKIKNSDIYAGVSYSKRTKLFTSLDNSIYSSSNDEIISNDENNQQFVLPETFGTGIGFKINNKFLTSIDYRFEKWSNAINNTQNTVYNNAKHFGLGVEYSPQNNQLQSIFNRIKYRFGILINDTYLKINNYDLVSKGFSCGVEIPFKQSGNTINIGYQFQQFGSNSGNLLKETQNSFRIGFTFKENWFMKSKFY